MPITSWRMSRFLIECKLRLIYFLNGLGNEVVREDDLEFSAMPDSKRLDLLDSGSYPIPVSFGKEWSCEADFHLKIPIRFH